MKSPECVSELLLEVLEAASQCTRAAVQEHYANPSAQLDLDHCLALVAAVHVDRALAADADWDIEVVLPPLSWSVHELIEWVARGAEMELLGSYTPRDTLTWTPAVGHGPVCLSAVARERHDLLIAELELEGVCLARQEVGV